MCKQRQATKSLFSSFLWPPKDFSAFIFFLFSKEKEEKPTEMQKSITESCIQVGKSPYKLSWLSVYMTNTHTHYFCSLIQNYVVCWVTATSLNYYSNQGGKSPIKIPVNVYLRVVTSPPVYSAVKVTFVWWKSHRSCF